jgi:hypothetical protein
VPGFTPLVVQRRPIQPRVTRDVTSEDGLPAHGVLLESLRTTDVTGVDPVYPVPAIDLGSRAPEPDADGVVFPAHIAAVAGEATADGRRDVLDLVAGQFRDDPADHAGRGTQTLVTRATGRVLRSAKDDWEPPSVLRVDGRIVNGGVVFTVDVDAADAAGGALLYRVDGDGLWRRLNLTPVGERRLSGAAPVPAGTIEVDSAIAQVLDDAGNVGAGRFKGRGYVAQRLPAPDPGGPRFALDPAQPASGWFTASPSITLDPGAHGPASGFVVSVDGGPETPYGGSFTIPPPVEGAHILTARAADGAQVERVLAIDAQGPAVTGAILTQPEAGGGYRGPVTVRWSCADATSGVAACPPDSVVSGPGLGLSVSATATDVAGNSGSGTVTGIDILPDVQPGFHVSIDPVTGGVLGRDGRLTGRVTDTLAAVTGVKVTYVPSGGFKPGGSNADNPRTVEATLTCNVTRSVCTWTVPAPPPGDWTARATATDADGRSVASGRLDLTVR